jgi:hypothetical protein
MIVSHTSGTIKRFGRTPWRFQTTFGTPLDNLDLFVSTIFSADPRIEEGCVTIDQVVFEPKQLMELLSSNSLPVNYGHDWSYTVTGKQQLHELLKASLAGWVDFLFIPTPKPFVIYADHDEYTTFYANTKSNLNRVADVLLEKGFKQIPDYQR